MGDKDRWVYGRADDRAMDDDRLDNTAANLRNGGSGGKKPSKGGLDCFGLVLVGLAAVVAVVALAVGLIVTDFTANTSEGN